MATAIPADRATEYMGATVTHEDRVRKAMENLKNQRENGVVNPPEEGKLNTSMMMGKIEDSIKLLVATMKNQSPDDPMKPAEIAQQFNSFAQSLGMLEIKKLLEGYMKSTGTNQLMQAASQLDKLAEVKASHFFYSPNTPCELRFEMPENSVKAAIVITDMDNRIIRTIEGDAKEGKNCIVWDGKDANEEHVKSGKFQFRVQAIDKNNEIIRDLNDKPLEVQTSVMGVAYGGVMKNNSPHINIAGTEYPVEALISIQSLPEMDTSEKIPAPPLKAPTENDSPLLAQIRQEIARRQAAATAQQTVQ